MATLKALIIGGGIAGPALAFWLAKAGHDVTVIERYPSLRAQGQQIDIRGQAISVVRRMGLLDQVRAKVVDEEGLRFEDVSGKSLAVFLANKTGKGAQSFTSEFEIMRGDLCRIFYEASRAQGVKYVFGKAPDRLTQDDDAVDVHFTDGTSDRFDLVVGADGQGSRVRKMIMSPEEEEFKSLGCYISYFTIPRQAKDTNMATVCNVPSRCMTLRCDNPKTTQAYLAIIPPDKETDDRLQRALASRDVAKEKQLWTRLFQDAGWQAPRILDEMNRAQTADDFYFQELGQVKSKTWYKGRVVLLGDAAHCPSPLTGLGTSSALVGAYVLAGEITKYRAKGKEENAANLAAALRAYDEVLRPFVEKAQTLSPGVPGLLYPKTWWGVWVLQLVLWLVALLRFDKLATLLGSDDVKGWELPDYPALHNRDGGKRGPES